MINRDGGYDLTIMQLHCNMINEKINLITYLVHKILNMFFRVIHNNNNFKIHITKNIPGKHVYLW